MMTDTSNEELSHVWKACCAIIGKEAKLDKAANLYDLGIDSLGLAELVIQLEEFYGEGAITVDDIMEEPPGSSDQLRAS